MTLRWPGDFDGVHHVAEARNDRLGQSPEANSITKPLGVATNGHSGTVDPLPSDVPETTREVGAIPQPYRHRPRAAFLSFHDFEVAHD